jgi:excisionase family DNA binding protein
MNSVEASNLLTVAEVCIRLRIGRPAVVHHIRTGRLRAANVGTNPARPRYRVRAEDVQAFIESASVDQDGERRRVARRRRPVDQEALDIVGKIMSRRKAASGAASAASEQAPAVS